MSAGEGEWRAAPEPQQGPKTLPREAAATRPAAARAPSPRFSSRVSSGRRRGRGPVPGPPQLFLQPPSQPLKRHCLHLRPASCFVLAACPSAPSEGKPVRRLFRMPVVTRRLRDPDINPCLLESDASARCMDENNYNRDMCSNYFLKYKNCRKFWNSIMIQRRQNGVKPPMPTAAERNEILGAMGKMPY